MIKNDNFWQSVFWEGMGIQKQGLVLCLFFIRVHLHNIIDKRVKKNDWTNINNKNLSPTQKNPQNVIWKSFRKPNVGKLL